MRPIALLTDFGLSDPYVGQMKGVLTIKAPGAPLIDLTHEVEPFQVGQASFFLAASVAHFPADTIFVAVVDPGVGTQRRIVLVQCNDNYFLAPDNGLLGFVMHGTTAFAWDVSTHARGASSTFHGRDVFAPLAAKLATGESPSTLGEPINPTDLLHVEASTPTELSEDQAGCMVQAHVLHIDRFGNVVLSLLPGELFERIAPAEAAFQGAPRMVRAYGDLEHGELGLLSGSQGFMELAVNQGSAAEMLELSLGDIFALGMPD
ncbi:MAG: SAM-dependent chlorinase/fluorinase [Proteobacteria bacterium]|nr:SAM-dependent chlorinase/fluorinase [Pseudomonadota bacterium]MBU1611418.1 SAM-dependent chlorinase/fluorinase [Pseudomonadota bacterium]